MLDNAIFSSWPRRRLPINANRPPWGLALLRLSLKVVAVSALLSPTSALAQVTANPGLNTNASPECSAGGACSITGGKSAGPNNLFHSFSKFDTRTWTAAGDVRFQNGSFKSVFVAVNSFDGTWITVPVRLNTAANLYLLSPGGINISGTGSFSNVLNLQLSTATSLRFEGGRVFDVNTTDVAGLDGNPQGFFTNLEIPGPFNNQNIAISNRLLVVDANLLLLDAQAGSIALFGDILTQGADFWATTDRNFSLAGLLNSSGGDINIRAGGDVSLQSLSNQGGGLESGGGRITLQSLTGSLSTLDPCGDCSPANGALSAGLGEILLSSSGDQDLSISSAGKIASESLQGLINISFDLENPLVIGKVDNPNFFGAALGVSGLNAVTGDFIVSAGGDVVLADSIALVGNSFGDISAGFGDSVQVASGAVVTTQTDGQIAFRGSFNNSGSLAVNRGQECAGRCHS
jgi:filamentous hemagglutinin family protein